MRLSVAVRTLCAFTARAGDLDLRFTPAPSASQGVQGHQLVQTRRQAASATYRIEEALQGQWGPLEVRGRADGYDPATGTLEEIKTVRGDMHSIKANQRALHWAQARIYGHLLCTRDGLASLRLALVYVHITTGKEQVLHATHSAAELADFFAQQCQRFIDWATQEAQHRQRRDAALRALTFPLGQLRAGQRALAVAVYRQARAAESGQCLLAQAPTGIGKTLGTVFPMLKACPDAGLDKVFFLTAKGTGHALALQALRQIGHALPPSEGAPTAVRVLTLLARDKRCVHPDKACHPDSCPLAQGFYDRLPAARQALINHAAVWDCTALRDTALAHGVCPYYLGQEMARWSDVVVGDYNYYYDNSAMLHALQTTEQWKVGVLVDEAHNLVDRARAMYSAPLAQPLLQAARQHSEGRVRCSLDKLQIAWNAFNRSLTQSYTVVDAVPAAWLAALNTCITRIAEAQEEMPLPGNHPLLEFYLAALQFASLAEQVGEHVLIDVQQHAPWRGKPRSTLSLRNVIPAKHLQARHAAAQASILFSGTLTPESFYRDMLGLPAHTQWLEVVAPFRAEQLAVHTASHISTRFRDRQNSVPQIAHVIAQQWQQLPGNYLCFVSSFAYLEQVAQYLQRHHPDLPLVYQQPQMDDAARAAYLEQFHPDGQCLGLAVLGGVFAEGVDLPGSRLVGAFVATLGLPQFNPVNEAMCQRLQQHFGLRKGHDYHYLYPGLRKVVQAAGRVIRTEHDNGVLYLMDDRYTQPSVRALLPAWWNV
jgi:DNA excision repair protein ERCC-2